MVCALSLYALMLRPNENELLLMLLLILVIWSDSVYKGGYVLIQLLIITTIGVDSLI